MQLGSVGYENKIDAHGNRLIWLDPTVVNRLRAMRGPGESYSDVILRVAAGESLGQQFLVALRPLADRLVRPSLAPIYIERPGKPPEQSGTSFLINHRDRPLLVTAKHCLFDDGPALEKLILFDGGFRPLGSLQTGEIISDPNNDLAVLYVDELGVERCLPVSCLIPGEITCGMISTIGFLARDFKRELSKDIFSSAPWLFHYKRAPKRPGQGYVGISFTRAETETRQPENLCNLRYRGACRAALCSTL
jgi:hypothetical protein